MNTSTTQEERVYSISIASKESFTLIMASKDSEQNCITGRDTVVKLKELPKRWRCWTATARPNKTA